MAQRWWHYCEVPDHRTLSDAPHPATPRPVAIAAPSAAPTRALLALAAAVLLVHAVLLQWMQGAQVLPSAAAALPLSVRQIAARAEAVTPAPALATEPARETKTADLAPPMNPRPRENAPPAQGPTSVAAPFVAPETAQSLATASAVEPVPGPEPAAPAAPASGVTAAAASPDVVSPAPPAATVATAASAPPADGSPSTGAPAPVYRTQPAPAATMVYELKRGLTAGQATLQWQPGSGPDGERYTLRLQAQAFGIDVAGWNSSGRFDAAGLAPDRYAESRRGREVRATNFQRAAGKISFSAQSHEFDLAEGAQDRSSWMLQLGAVLNANPAQAQPGARTTMVVAGTRGEPEPWVFTVVDRAPLTLGDGDTATTVPDAVQLLREPRRPYDTRARIWLDPARHHLPLKVQLLVHATGEGQEFELRQLRMP
jgi:Protein of unknown function (DUF3108)